MSDIRPTIAAWQQRISGSTRLAGVIVAVLIVAMVGLGCAGFLARNAIVAAVFDAGTFDAGVSAGPGAVWAVTFLSVVAPGILFSLVCALYVATYRWWSFAALLLSIALLFVGMGATLPIRSRNDPPVQPLTELLLGLGADRPTADVMTDAFWMGLLTLGFVAAFGCAWAVALAQKRPTPGAADEPAGTFAAAFGAFRWIYPVALAVVLSAATAVGIHFNS